jgi:hypothetical protein
VAYLFKLNEKLALAPMLEPAEPADPAKKPRKTNRPKVAKKAKIHQTLENAVAPTIGFGSALVAVGQELGDNGLNFPRDKRPVEPGSFE